MIAVYTGLRPSELCTLAVEDFDLSAGMIEITPGLLSRTALSKPQEPESREPC